MTKKAFKITRIDGKRQAAGIKANILAGKVSLLPPSRIRVWPFVVGLVVTALFLWGRLFTLTVVEGSYQRGQADLNRVVAIRTAAPRGVFFDVNGTPLTVNEPTYKRQVPGTSVAQAQFESISKDQAIALTRVSGERVFFDISRHYPCGRACEPLLGFLGEVDENELQSLDAGYVLGDKMGKSGLEKEYEATLRGKPGSEMVEVDAMGKLVRVVGKEEQMAGQDIRLTIDEGLQQKLYTLLEGRAGAIVAQIPQTGEVLAMVSSPAFDPNDVAGSLTEPDEPFFNRAIGGAYPPGSVFKIAVATAGLESGTVTPEDTYQDTGEITIDAYRFGNWLYDQYGRTEGEVNIVKALQRSNDIYFYHLGADMGPETLAEWATMLGYGQVSSLGALGEVAGTVPTPEWKEKTKGEKWFLGNTYHMAIGQGDVMVTPLQVNRVTAAIAADGVLCDPILLQQQVGVKSCKQLNLKAETLSAVKEGMKEACMPGGTGVPFFHFSPQVACKTGTAQQGNDTAHPHAWFTAYAPADAPEIAITVLVEKAGEGSEVAAPVAQQALDYWFNQKK